MDDKYIRGDTLRLLSSLSVLSKDEIRNIYLRANRVGEYTSWKVSGKTALRFLAERVIDKLEDDFLFEDLEFVPIQYRDQVDSSNGKLRHIGIQDVYQQICDYVAVYGLEDIFRRFGEYQCASIKGRGQSYGIKAIKKWMREDKNGFKFFGKADVRHCFESIDIDILLKWMNKRVKNPDLMWLVEKLLRSFEHGLSIGSYLSQHLCNLFMSILYHFLAEDESMFYGRRGEKIHNIKHQLFYMDDIFICGDNKSKMVKAFKLLCKKAKELGLTIKPTWFVSEVVKVKFVDMMGVKIYQNHVEIRKTVWKRVRRCMIRLNNAFSNKRMVSLKMCKKFLSYYGLIKNTDSVKVTKKYKVKRLLRRTKGVVRNESKNRCEAGFCSDSSSRQYTVCAALSA